MTDPIHVDLDVLAGPDPHPVLARLRASRPVAWVAPLGGWLVTSYAVATAVLRDPGTFTVDDPRFTTAQVVGASMLSTDGAEHDRHREPFDGALRGRELLADLGASVRARAGALVATVAPTGHGDLRDALAGPLAAGTVADLLGLGELDTGTLRSWYRAIVDAVTRLSAGDTVPAGTDEAVDALRSAVLDAARRLPDSLVGQVAGTLSDDDLAANAAVLLFGGIETAEGATATTLWHLLDDPDRLAAVRDDPGLVRAAVEESLRLEPAAARVDRYATRDAELAGATVEAGDLVVVSLTAANRDPEVFSAPDRYDLERPDAARHLAFARGPHACVAAHVARLEAAVAVEAVLEGLPDDLRLDPAAAPAAPTGLVFRKPAAVEAVWTGS